MGVNDLEIPGLELDPPEWKESGSGAVISRGKYKNELIFAKLVDLKDKCRQVEFFFDNKLKEMIIDIKEKKNDESSRWFLDAKFISKIECDFTDPVFHAKVDNEQAWKWVKRFMQKKRFPRIKKTFGLFVSRDVGAPSLHEWVKKPEIESGKKVQVFAQVVQALKILSEYQITHNDLHWNNIFVEKNGQPLNVGGKTYDYDFRPVIFDWDRSVCGDEDYKNLIQNISFEHTTPHVSTFDAHYDLIGFYKNIRKYQQTLNPFLSSALFPQLEKTFTPLFDAFPSLNLTTRHRANPCLSVQNDENGNPTCIKDWSKYNAWKSFKEKKPTHDAILTIMAEVSFEHDTNPGIYSAPEPFENDVVRSSQKSISTSFTPTDDEPPSTYNDDETEIAYAADVEDLVSGFGDLVISDDSPGLLNFTRLLNALNIKRIVTPE